MAVLGAAVMAEKEARGVGGRAELVWLNDYACVLMSLPGARLVVDPVGVRPDVVGTVDAVLITHEHYDHLDADLVSSIQARSNCLVVADPTSSKLLSRYIPGDKLLTVKPGSQLTIGGARIYVEDCNHPPASTPVTFLVEASGIKVYHTADSLPFRDMARIGEAYRPNVVFCTVGIAPRTSPSTGAEIAKLVRPDVAIPYHTMSRSDLEKFCSILSREAPDIRCVILEKGEVFTFP